MRNRVRRGRLAVILALVASLGVACGGDTEEGATTTTSIAERETTTSTSTTTTTTTTSTTEPAPPPDPCPADALLVAVADFVGSADGQTVSLLACESGWAMFDACDAAEGCFGDSTFLARQAGGAWQVVTSFPSSMCRSEVLALGAPTGVVDEVGWSCETPTTTTTAAPAAASPPCPPPLSDGDPFYIYAAKCSDGWAVVLVAHCVNGRSDGLVFRADGGSWTQVGPYGAFESWPASPADLEAVGVPSAVAAALANAGERPPGSDCGTWVSP